MRTRPIKSRKKNGYLLLEATIAMAIAAIILTAVLKIMDWNLKVSNNSIENSNNQMKEAAFFSFMDRAFNEMTGDANVNLTFTETPKYYLSELIIQNSCEPFTWAGQPFNVKAVKIVTRLNSSNKIDVVLEYYTDYLISSPMESGAVVLPDQEPIQSLKILENVSRFEWRAWDGTRLTEDGTPAWMHDWEQSRPPRYFELNVIFSEELSPVVHTFWNPRKVNPTAHFKVQQNRIKQSQSNDNNNEENADDYNGENEAMMNSNESQ